MLIFAENGNLFCAWLAWLVTWERT